MAATSFSQFASSILLVAMSIDRYIAVCHPIFAQRFRLKGVAIRISISVWLACAILMSPLVSRPSFSSSRLLARSPTSQANLSTVRGLHANS